MKILNVNDSLDRSRGGTNERTFQMSRALARAGQDVTTLVTGTCSSRGMRADYGFKTVALKRLNDRFYVPTPALSEIRGLVHQADIVHLMGHWSVLNALVYREAIKTSRPYVVCPAGALPVAGRSRALKRIYNVVVGENLIRNAERLIAITAKEKSDFLPYGAVVERIVTIPNAIDVSDCDVGSASDLLARKGLTRSPFALFMGRLNHIKGPDLLVEAFARAKHGLPDYQLVIAGPDEGLGEELKNTAARLGMTGRVHFLGCVQGPDKSALYGSARFVVIPSRREAMSMVALEAGGFGTPVLLTDQCGFEEVSAVGGGISVSATVEALTEGLIRMASFGGRLQEMGRQLRRLILQSYSWESIAQRYLRLYEEILDL